MKKFFLFSFSIIPITFILPGCKSSDPPQTHNDEKLNELEANVQKSANAIKHLEYGKSLMEKKLNGGVLTDQEVDALRKGLKVDSLVFENDEKASEFMR